LPWQCTSQEVHHHVANALHVVSAGFITYSVPCSMPKWVLMEAYRAVPVRFLPSLYGMCLPSL
jgi:hypothetical protein